MSFDLTLSFDKAEYLNPQIYLFADTLKDNIPDDTVLHITTNREPSDEPLSYLFNSVKHVIVYPRQPFNNLKSRCQYMFHSFDIKSDADWIIKMELDTLILKHLSAFNDILEKDLDIVVEPENRKIFDDNTANRLWRIIYREMGMNPPPFKIQFRENKEEGLPLFGTGIVCVRNHLLDKINEKWVPLTKICEKWIDMNIHPNEMAFTALVLNEGWKWKIYPDKYKFNPIGHFRDGEFPSTKLKDDCKLPDDTIIFDYHRPEWLFHVSKKNEKIASIISRNKDKIPQNWWGIPINSFTEGL